MLKIKWTKTVIKTEQDLSSMVTLFNTSTIVAAAFDTETTGLSHVHDLPFLFQFGWYTPDLIGYAFAVDLEVDYDFAIRVITIWNNLAAQCPIYLGHNVKFDLHMQNNIGIDYRANNISDTMYYIRLSSDAVPERKGGTPLGLKAFATQFILPEAKYFEKELDEERASIAATYNLQLQRALNTTGSPPENVSTTKKYKSWTKGCLDAFFKDKTNDSDDLPEQAIPAYEAWHASLPEWLAKKVTGYVTKDMIRYSVLNRATLVKYALLDIVWTLETYLITNEIIIARGQQHAIELENANIYPLLDMERVGLVVDIPYIKSCAAGMKTYIRARRKDLCRLAGFEITIGQRDRIAQVLKDNYNITVESTGAEELDRLVSDMKHNGKCPQAIEFIEVLQELRTLEKWYSTYICRFLYELQFSNKIYTTINAAGTVSGRVTSDFQQFPKGAIISITGEELFCPRRMVLANDEDFIGIVYLDYSQIELRLQAMFTILVGHPDLNLCRAYSPYKCHTFVGDEAHQQLKPYDYNDKWCIKHAYDYTWYYDETPDKKWTPLDVHGATTKIAFGVDETDETFHDLRYKGKRVNFAKNYGAQFSKIKEMFPEYSDEQIHKIDDAYYTAFPGVKEYHNYCYRIANIQSYVCNLFGVKYYNASGHNLINMLVQGTGAYYLKWKIAQVNKYMKERGVKSVLMMQIHDELQWKWHKDDSPQIFFDMKRIMEDWDDTLIPIIADMELTKTTWKDKYEVSTIEEFYKEDNNV